MNLPGRTDMAKRLVMVIVLSMVLVAPGCTDDDESANEDLANEFCQSWSEQLSQVAAIPDVQVVFEADADERDVVAIRSEVEDRSDVASMTWVDKEAAYDEFVELFKDTPEMIEAASPEILPSRLRIELVEDDVDARQAFAAEFEGRPGVLSVVTVDYATGLDDSVPGIADYYAAFCE